MIKRILFILFALLLTSYLVFAVIFLNPKANAEEKCTHLQVDVVCPSETSYLNETQVKLLLNKANLNPVGKNQTAIDMALIEKALEEDKLIKKAEVYKTINGTVRIKIYQRTPILRVIAGRDYYIDNEGEIMPVPAHFATYVPVATGNIKEEYAKKQLFPFVLFLQKNEFWSSQIEQINIAPNLDVELIPRVGNHQIILGKIENYEENLDKLKLFYEKGLNKVGWNRYSIINLKYKNQVVCTKRE
jgi:cell division protein FtsQ